MPWFFATPPVMVIPLVKLDAPGQGSHPVGQGLVQSTHDVGQVLPALMSEMISVSAKTTHWFESNTGFLAWEDSSPMASIFMPMAPAMTSRNLPVPDAHRSL